jgi:hypothetical protein
VAARLQDDAMGQLMVLSSRWFPGRKISPESMGEALFLENDYWEKMSIAVQNGIAKAFKG